MSDRYVRAAYQKLDKGLYYTLIRSLKTLGRIRNELASAVPASDADRHLWRWAFIYTVILTDIASSAIRLLVDGKHSRAAMILQRMAFEYRTRFHYYWTHEDERKTAMDEFTRKAALFAQRIGPEHIQLILDTNFDDASFDASSKGYKNFEKVCNDVFGDAGKEYYARFYSYASALLHGDAFAGMDVLEFVNDDEWLIHLTSRRPFTNNIAGNLLLFFLDFSGDVCRAFDLKSGGTIRELGHDFNAARRRLGIL